MGWLLEYIDKIRARPDMYIGGSSTDELHSFMLGYMSARSDFGLPELDDNDIEMFDHFQYWIEMKFDTRSAQYWTGLIADNYDGIAETSIEAFYVLFDEYRVLLKKKSFLEIKSMHDNFLNRKKEELVKRATE
ncbi:MAG: hypothetical protein ABW176_15470 [Candidatus Thiodiazotropha endolucinida]